VFDIFQKKLNMYVLQSLWDFKNVNQKKFLQKKIIKLITISISVEDIHFRNVNWMENTLTLNQEHETLFIKFVITKNNILMLFFKGILLSDPNKKRFLQSSNFSIQEILATK
jgi:hypothetical protein